MTVATTSYALDVKPVIYTAPTTTAWQRFRADHVCLTREALAQVGGPGIRYGQSWSVSCTLYQEIDGVFTAFPLAISDGVTPVPEWTPAVVSTRIYQANTATLIGSFATTLADQVTYPGQFTLALASTHALTPGSYQLMGVAAWMSTVHPHTAVLGTETIFSGYVEIAPPLPT
jgi:hypothetical protein